MIDKLFFLRETSAEGAGVVVFAVAERIVSKFL